MPSPILGCALASFGSSPISLGLEAVPSRWRLAAGRLLRNRSLMAGALLVLFVASLSCLAYALAPYDPLKSNFRARLEPPSLAHWFGTDHFGRDLFSRVIYGGR